MSVTHPNGSNSLHRYVCDSCGRLGPTVMTSQPKIVRRMMRRLGWTTGIRNLCPSCRHGKDRNQ